MPHVLAHMGHFDFVSARFMSKKRCEALRKCE